jgi:hypothetical protein
MEANEEESKMFVFTLLNEIHKSDLLIQVYHSNVKMKFRGTCEIISEG